MFQVKTKVNYKKAFIQGRFFTIYMYANPYERIVDLYMLRALKKCIKCKGIDPISTSYYKDVSVSYR